MANNSTHTLGEWASPEWYDPADGDYTEAYASSDEQYLVEAEVTYGRRLHGPEWFWVVKATSRLSEWPEVQDYGTAKNRDAAMAAAEAAATKACAGKSPRSY